jgi:1-phosphofructokinase family hexose kinase
MILTVTLNPALDITLTLNEFKPHDTNRIQTIQTDAGGKGINLSRVAAELGSPTTATGFLGGDSGQLIRSVMLQQGVVDECISVNQETRTNFNIESGDGPPTTLNAKGAEVSADEWLALIAKVTALSSQANWVCLGGSLPPGVPSDALAILGHIAKQAGANLLLDADGPPMIQGLKANPDLIKPNINEAARLLNAELQNTNEDATRAANTLFDQLKAKGSQDPIVLISRGSKGAILKSSQGLFIAEPIPIQAKSTIGSGDSMLAGFLHGLLQNDSHAQALRLANAAGAATALTDGAHIGRKQTIQELLQKSIIKN